MDGCSLLRGIFPTQGMNPGLPHGRYSLPAEPPGKSALPFKDSSDGFRLTKENLFFLKLHRGYFKTISVLSLCICFISLILSFEMKFIL